jgi:sugar phosphate isomerase/epimerase
MLLAYNTNGFAHHSLPDALDLLAARGYRGVQVTLDVNHLNPFDLTGGYARQLGETKARLKQLQLECVIETGARFLLNRERKHYPTLLSDHPAERGHRRNFIQISTVCAATLGGKVVSFWSGTPLEDAPPSVLMARLVDECKRLADHAGGRGVRLAFEPEPGMFIDTMDKFAELHGRVNHPHFGLTLDVGHLVCLGELPVSEHIRRWKDWLWNVHIEDMRAGVHDHLMFGEGEVDFADVFAGLTAVNYAGLVGVELSRHSHDAVRTAEKAMGFLKGWAG